MQFRIKKILPRLLIFVVGLPVVFALVHFFPMYNHALTNITLTVLCALGALELREFFCQKNIAVNKIFAVFLGALLPLSATLEVGFLKLTLFVPALFLGVIVIITKTLFGKTESALQAFAANLALLFYPAFPLSALIFLNRDDPSALSLFFFLAIVIINDSMAWFFGLTLGKNNRGVVKLSPNKSVAGFVGGVLSACVAGYFFGKVLFFSFSAAPLVIAFITAVMALLGDLAESALKRSANLKDSGALFPGRGGVLDSLDSMALAAPVFYALNWLFST